mgnify:CR=1 FL=1
MSQIKKFIDKITYAEARQSKDIIMSVTEAKELRDEVMKILVDMQSAENPQEQTVEVVMKGGKWWLNEQNTT